MGWQTADQISPAGSLALGEFRVDHIIGGAAGGGSAIAVSAGGAGGSTICTGLLVHRGTGGIEGLLELFQGGLDRSGVVLLDGSLEVGGEAFHLGLVVGGHLVAQFAEPLLGLVDQGFNLVLQDDLLALLLIPSALACC